MIVYGNTRTGRKSAAVQPEYDPNAEPRPRDLAAEAQAKLAERGSLVKVDDLVFATAIAAAQYYGWKPSTLRNAIARGGTCHGHAVGKIPLDAPGAGAPIA